MNSDSLSTSSVSSSSGDKMLTSSTSSSSSDSSSCGKSKALKEKSVTTNNKVNGSEICQNGRAVRGKDSTINGGKENAAKRAENGKEGRTTMMIRLHPGKTNKLSAYLENQVTFFITLSQSEALSCLFRISRALELG